MHYICCAVGKLSIPARLPMGISKTPDEFQARMQAPLSIFENSSNNILVLTETTFSNHIKELEQVFICLKSAGLPCHAPKCKFAAYETEYLGYNLTPMESNLLLRKFLPFIITQLIDKKHLAKKALDQCNL
jgi:hypothetical protein